MTVTSVMGCGRQKGYLPEMNFTGEDINLLPKIMVFVVVEDEQTEEILADISTAVGTGKNYPYMLVNPENLKLEEGKTYQVAISGISEKLASETEVTDSGIVGLDAAKDFLGQFKTLSEADAEWK